MPRDSPKKPNLAELRQKLESIFAEHKIRVEAIAEEENRLNVMLPKHVTSKQVFALMKYADFWVGKVVFRFAGRETEP
jgi:hypothetical protein